MKCKRCKSELEFIPNYTHEDIETNEDRTDSVWLCECGTLHYKENGCDVYEFSAMPESYLYVKQVTDYDIALENKLKEKEYAE